MAADVSLRAVVHGRVQGVGFRYFVVQKARDLKLKGYVRNLPDGRSVESIAEGQRESLERLLSYLEQGPPEAEVGQVDVSWSEASGVYERFRAILRETPAGPGVDKAARSAVGQDG